MGPELIGDTRSEVGVFRLLHVLRAIMKWGRETFKVLYQKGVIDKLLAWEQAEAGMDVGTNKPG